MNRSLHDAGADGSEWRQGWPAVAAATTGYGCSIGMFQMSASLFITPMRTEFGWSMSEAAFAPIVVLLMALMMPLGGMVIDRFSARSVALFGLSLFATAYVALATLPMSLFLLYAVATCLGLLAPTGNAGPYVRLLATWFSRHTGSAFGVAMSGTSIAGMVVIPTVAIVIDRFGWRSGYLTMTAIILVVALPLVLLKFHARPAAPLAGSGLAGVPGGMTMREALAGRDFWLLMLALLLAALPMGALSTHLQPLLRSQGFTLTEAAFLGSFLAMTVLIGRIGCGLLMDRFWSYGVAAGLLAVGAAGSFAITTAGPGLHYAFTLLIVGAVGLSFGAEVDFSAYFTLKLFGLRSYATIFGLSALAVGVGYAAGGILSSMLYDRLGDYGPLGLLTGTMFLLAALTMFGLGVSGRNRRQPMVIALR